MLEDFTLTREELNTLAELLAISLKQKERKALCIKIGIKPQELDFLHNSSDESFAINLVDLLYNTGNTEAICQCCKEIAPVFKKGKRESFLKEIARKLNCNQEPDPPPDPRQNQVKVASIIATSIILLLLVVLAVFHPDRSVDYTHLQNLLASGKWKEADKETQDDMLKLAGREKEGFLRDPEHNPADFQKIGCTALEKIDQLWVNSSSGRFGFSVQKHIWNELKPQTLKALYERIGWTVNQNRKDYDNLTFSLNAPQGHLPAAGEYSQGRGGWVSQCL